MSSEEKKHLGQQLEQAAESGMGHEIQELENPEADQHLPGRGNSPLRFLQSLDGLLIIALSLFITVVVLLRVAGIGVTGAVELGAMSMVVLVALGIPAVTRADENFRLEIIDFFVSAKTLSRLDAIGLAIQLVVTCAVWLFSVDLFINDVRTQTTMGGEKSLSRYWLTGAVAVGFAGVLYALIQRSIVLIKKWGK